MMLLPKKFGSITLMRKLGTDGVAECFSGILDEPAGKMVIVRRLLPYVTRDAALLSSVEDRINDLAAVRHTSLVPTLDYTTVGDERLIVEEWVDSIGLDQLVEHCRDNGRSVPHNVYLDIATQICNGLEALHGRPGASSGSEHVLHLGLRPSAVRISRDGRVLVGDFGLIRSPTSLPHGSVGPVHTLMEYLSPEQTHPDRELTPASDIFSLGSILYEFLTLEPLFRAQSNLQTIHRVRKAEVTPHLLRVKEILPGLDKVLYRALSLNPRHRYQRSFVLREDLRGLMAGYTFSNITEETLAFLQPLMGQGDVDAGASSDPMDESTASLLARAVMGDPGPATPGPVHLEPAASLPEFDPPPRPNTLVPDEIDEDALFPPQEDEGEITAPEPAMPRRAMDTYIDHGDDDEDFEDEGVPTSIDDAGVPTSIDETAEPAEARPKGIQEQHTSWVRRETLAPPEEEEADEVPEADEPPTLVDAVEPPPEDQAVDETPVAVPPEDEGEITTPGVAAFVPSDEPEAAPPSSEPAPESAWAEDEGPTDVRADPSQQPAPPRSLADRAPSTPGPVPPREEPASTDPPAESKDADDWDDLDYKPAGGGMGKWLIIGGSAIGALALIGLCAGLGAGGLGLGFLSMGGPDQGEPEVVAQLEVEGPADPVVPATQPDEPDSEGDEAETTPATQPVAEPVRSDPVRSDPVRSDPVRSDPVRSDPVRSDPVRTEVVSSGTDSSWTRPTPEPDPPADDPDDLFVDVGIPAEEPKGTFEPTELVPPPPPQEDVDILIDFDEVRSELAQYQDRAYRGALTEADRTTLEGVPISDPDYTQAMVILYQDAKARGDSHEREEYVTRVMALPENRYNPQLLCEQAAISLERRDYASALEAANLAERHWARLPSEHIFVRKAMIYEVQAASHQGLFYQSEGENMNELQAAIRAWEKYQRHVQTKSRTDLADKAGQQLAKLHDIQSRLE